VGELFARDVLDVRTRQLALLAAFAALGLGDFIKIHGGFVQQAPKGFNWQVPPAPAGADGLTQGVSPQTLSVAEDSPHKKEAVAFLDFLLRPRNMVRLALGDWMLPTGTQAPKDPALHTAKEGWTTGTSLAAHLRPAPAKSVRGPSRSTTAARSGWTNRANAWRRTGTWCWPGTSAEPSAQGTTGPVTYRPSPSYGQTLGTQPCMPLICCIIAGAGLPGPGQVT
jgi:hypothetical protein